MAKPKGLLLTPGAGSDRDNPTLIAIERGLDPFPVERMDLKSRSVPKCVEKVRAGLDTLVERGAGPANRLLIGGRSFGGRMCSVAAANGVEVAGLVLLSYPLHPPGKPQNLRTDHFPALTVPCLFVSGDRDPFGTIEEFERETAAIVGPVTHVWLPGGGHNPKTHEAAIIEAITDWMRGR